MNKVLVTGANGHIGLALVELLIKNEYEVYAGVRNVKDESKTARLKSLGATIVQADITNKDQLLKASKGMTGIFHLAAVFAYGTKDVENRIIKPTIAGAINMVEAAIENNVKKLIMTSSVVAIGGGDSSEEPHDETHWNNDTKIPYYKAKVESERQAWELVENSLLKMNTIHPGAVIGPGFEKSTPTTDIFINTLQNNYPGIPPLRLSVVDVRDIATAHLMVYETENSEGRYIAAGKNMTFEEMIDKIIEARPKTKKPTKLPGFFVKLYAWTTTFFRKLVFKSSEYTYTQAKEQISDKSYYSDKKLEALGWTKMDLNQSIIDTIEWIEKNDFLNKK